jgi:uncharacterized repeat protein (TIGR04076 family)
MYELKVTATKVLGVCTADSPVKPGDTFTVCDGDIRIPAGGVVCLWALHSLLPLITPKEREIVEDKDEDWMWRVQHAQCPDPKGRVIFKIERVGKVEGGRGKMEDGGTGEQRIESVERIEKEKGEEGKPRDLRVVVEEVRGKCTSGMRPGDYFLLRSGRLIIPVHRHFCLYALQAVLPFLSAKQRHLQDGDWLKDEHHFICPDPAGNVIMRIEQLP